MNSTQNKKIEQVKETTMIVGIDVGSEKHYFRAFNWRGIELTRKPVPFSNSMEGFNSFYNTIVLLMKKSELEEALVGIEPTGHYWFDLGQFMGAVILIEVRQLYFCLTRHYIFEISLYFSSSKQPYSSSVTISSHSLEVSSPGHSIAR